MNAFETLGLTADAGEEEIRQAYHTLVKTCHPDQFSPGEEQQKAQDKLVRLNLAYEEALRLTAGRQAVYRTVPAAQAKQVARKLMEQERFDSALLQLSRAENKDGEWYFIQGQVLMGMRQYGSAHQAFREAVRLEPENKEYRQGALAAALEIKKHQKLAYRMADWAGDLFHSRKKQWRGNDMNLPNKLTLLRIVMIPVCLALWALGQPVAAAAVFALAAATDFLDGYIARKRNIVTVFGKFADPVADKVLVLTAMVFLCADGHLPAWAVSIVAARELLVDGLRLVAAGKGNVIAAGWLGKIKTNAQYFCVLSGMLLPKGHFVTLALAILMSVMTVWSGAQYFWASRKVFTEDAQ